MNTGKQMYEYNTWTQIDWKTVEKQVFKLQKRIYRASQSGNVKLVHRLQRLLLNSYYGKLMATRRVTQDNTGKKTAGVDGVKSLTQKERLSMVKALKLGNKVKPSRRVWIPKPNTEEKRPLGIPPMYERALQALVKLALEPQWESHFEGNSYGFRPARNPHDAIAAIFLAINRKPKYVLDADIAKCFDKINHQKLLSKLETYPKLRRQIKSWLKSGVIDKGDLFPTEEGTPQGGVISPLLANIALHGMEERIKEYAGSWKGNKEKNQSSISLIRYADDFVILHEDLEVIKQCQVIIQDWLKEWDLELKPSKTCISHTLEPVEGKVGFNFLGFTIRQFPQGRNHCGKNTHGHKLGFKTFIKPSKAKIKAHLQKIGDIIRSHKSSPQIALIQELNPVIRGWTNYYSNVVSKVTFGYCDAIMYQQLRRWAQRRHPKKNKSWVVNKYWHSQDNRNWVFSTRKGEKSYTLRTHKETPIVRHIKVKGEASPFDGNLIYWSTRLGRHPETPREKAILLKRQKGKCPHCGLYFRNGDLMETDHITPKKLGGDNSIKNKQLLHRHCHDKKTASDGSLNRTHDKGSQREKRNEVKVSRSVLKTSQRGDSLA
jgi:RNA-directed DNA polymerase